MLAPTPVFKPSPMGVGDVFASAITVLKARLGTLLIVAGLPMAVSLLGMAVLGALLTTSLTYEADHGGEPSPALFIAMTVFGLALSVIVTLINFKAMGMLTAATYEIGQGQRPTVSSLLASTKGFLPRIVPLMLLGFAVFIVVYGAIIAVIVSTGSAGSARAGGAMALLVLGMVVIGIPVALLLTVKLLYTVQIVALQGVGGIAALKGSWKLTAGSFWRTFGTYLVVAMVVQAVSGAISTLTQIAMFPALRSAQNVTDDPEVVLAALSSLLPYYIVAVLLQMAVSMFMVPFQQAYITTMYLDQVRRSEMPTWTPSAGGYPAPAFTAGGGARDGLGQNAGWYPPPPPAYPNTGWQAPPPPNYPGQPPQPGQ